ncbi:retrovirus-related pol polyprotein from transposon TNT 1-94 [Tanacetum coccineum]
MTLKINGGCYLLRQKLYKLLNATFVNSLPRKWLSMNQTQRANNSIKNNSLATLYGKYNYEEGLIDQIYESETQIFSIQASSSKALISNIPFQDSDSDVEEDQRTNNEFMADLNAKYNEIALLSNQKRFYKRSRRVGSARKPIHKTKETCFACRKTRHFQKDCLQTKHPLYPIHPQTTHSTNLNHTHHPSTKHLPITLNLCPQGMKEPPGLELQLVDITMKKSELSNLKNTVSINCSLQNEVIRVNLENESMKDKMDM